MFTRTLSPLHPLPFLILRVEFSGVRSSLGRFSGLGPPRPLLSFRALIRASSYFFCVTFSASGGASSSPKSVSSSVKKEKSRLSRWLYCFPLYYFFFAVSFFFLQSIYLFPTNYVLFTHYPILGL